MASELEVGKARVGTSASTETLAGFSDSQAAIVGGDNVGLALQSTNSNKSARVRFFDDSGNQDATVGFDNSTSSLFLGTGTAAHLTLDQYGNAIFKKGTGAYLQLSDGSAVRGSIHCTTSDGLVFSTGASFTERMTISSTGAVDISGPASHATALTVGNSTGGTELQVIPKENESITLNSTEGTTAHALILATGGTPRLTVASTGLATFSNGITVSGGFTTLGSFPEVTISGGGLAVTSSTHRVDTEEEASSDDLYGITGGTDGSILILQIVHTDREVTVKHSNGTTGQNIRLDGGADFTLDHTTDVLTLVKHGSFWCEVSRSNN